MSRLKRLVAVVLVTGLSFSLSVCATAPNATYDESFYINLDCYGAIRNSNIVKSFSLNGQACITDYGTYDSVQNMSNDATPVRTDEGVTFSFDSDAPSRFYFEAKTNTPLENIPWKVNLTYKLNGVPVDPATLAGTKGLVEIDLDLIPNEAAPEYFRNNMVLTATTTLDYDKIYSVEAPGAQIQSVGNYKAIAFMALPGETCHFVARLGSDCFEFGGFTFLMVPATFSQMDQIRDLREAKETLEDSATAISKSLDVILDCMGSLSGSLDSTADGLSNLEEARRMISQGKGQIYTNFDQSLADLESISLAMKPMEGDFTTAKETLSQANKDLSALNDTSKSMRDNIASTKKVLQAIKTDTGALQDFMEDFDDTIAPLNTRLDQLASSLERLNGDLDDVETSMNAQLIEVAPGVKLSISEIQTIISATNTLKAQYDQDANGAANFRDYLITALNSAEKGELFYGIWLNQAEINKELAPLTTITGGLNDISSTTSDVASQTASVIRTFRQMQTELDRDYSELGDALLEDGEALSTEGIKLLERLDTMIVQMDALQSTLNAYEPKAESTLEHTADLVGSLSTGSINLKTLLANSETLLKQSGVPLDAGTSQTLKGLIDTLRSSTKGLHQTAVIKASKNTIKETIDDQWAEYTGEQNNLLLMDASSEKPSLTSTRNGAPETIQILMRSDEITLKAQEEKASVDESYVPEGNVFSRIGSVFQAIGNAVSSLFS